MNCTKFVIVELQINLIFINRQTLTIIYNGNSKKESAE